MIDRAFSKQERHEVGKDALQSIADLGASRAGRLVVEIRDNLWQLNQSDTNAEYLINHIRALFEEFITGEEYDLPYYNKPEAKIDDDLLLSMVKITWDNINNISSVKDYDDASERLDKGEVVWMNKDAMSIDVESTCTNINSTGQCQGCKVCWVKAQKGLMPPHPPNTHYMNDPNCKCSSCKSTSSRIKITFDNIHQIKEMKDFDRALGMLYRKEEVWIGRDQMMQDEYDVS